MSPDNVQQQRHCCPTTALAGELSARGLDEVSPPVGQLSCLAPAAEQACDQLTAARGKSDLVIAAASSAGRSGKSSSWSVMLALCVRALA